ncbi:high affinity cationic amino acid transporter 1 [Neocloeon triangulifer]|uniref:high affinity cationic amino acid transporter 1 n=1 Tax=Neocloeon triangulifer TaxID=2078957 RepID=UPI00286F16A8|nr:high affinity cationic amino acid transporter 1 [Neocloeon triangulifer]XP_059476678.1 high affinity cationic amino acid transporter 1 [Neocloeon triangulifer]
MAARILSVMGRRKRMEDDAEGSQLARVLSVLDLTALGVGSTLGLGVYVLAGAVARDTAGPAVTLSFLVAAIASAFAALCYAEFAARVPKAGSAYVYSYVSVGEFVAFVIGWNLILEYVIGTASVARGMSSYIDALTNYTMRDAFISISPKWEIDFLSKYPDFFSFFVIMLLAVLLATGVKESTMMNNIFTALNLITIAIVIVAGGIKADFKNWNIPKESIPKEVRHRAGEGGFMPFGFSGVMAGAAKCFYGFVGFDSVATTGEEARNPQRSIPLAIAFSLVIIFFAYFGISGVLTLMWPYYDQDPDAPFPYVFEQIGWPVIKWIVTVGAIFALCTCLLGAMFPLPRVLYAMAKDRLIFHNLSRIHPRTKTPLVATISSGILAGLMAMLFDLQQLIDMMSIGTLLAYTIVAICVLVLRYQESEDPAFLSIAASNKAISKESEDNHLFGHLFNYPLKKVPSAVSSAISKWGICLFSALAAGLCACIIYSGHDLVRGRLWTVVLTTLLALSLLFILVVIARQPKARTDLSFKVPWVPIIPALSVIFNLYLMLELDGHTWIRFSVWMALGFLIYICYAIPNSEEGRRRKEDEIAKEAYTNDAFADDNLKKDNVTSKF